MKRLPALKLHQNLGSVRKSGSFTDVRLLLILHFQKFLGWRRVDSKTHLMADGIRYDLIGAEGIIIDEKLSMPEDGDSLFVLNFAPLPMDTKSFGLIEGHDDTAWRLYGRSCACTTVLSHLPAVMRRALYSHWFSNNAT